MDGPDTRGLVCEGLPPESSTVKPVPYVLDAEPMIVLLQVRPLHIIGIDDTGAHPVVEDLHSTWLLSLGCKRVTRSRFGRGRLSLGRRPAERWRAELSPAGHLRITGSGKSVYDGTFGPSPRWRALTAAHIHATGGIVMLTGLIHTVDQIPATLAEGSVIGIRIPLAMTAEPSGVGGIDCAQTSPPF